MQLAVMKWVGITVQPGSVFGVLDKANPGMLPTIAARGHWAEYQTIEEDRFTFAEEAKRAIARDGYFIVGVGLSVVETFGLKPSAQAPT